MDILLFENFSKRKNSTKRPDDASGTADNVVLKDAASLVNPAFLLARTDSKWNYIKWAGRYYYVDDIVRNNAKMSEYRCSLDVLATFRTNIRESSAYVVRSAYTTDRTKQDPQVAIFNGYAARSTASEKLVAWSSDYSYLITSVGVACKCVYVLTESQYVELMGELFSQSNFASLFDYIMRVVKVPIKADTLSQGTSTVAIGNYVTHITAGIAFTVKKWLNNVMLGHLELNHAYSDWRNYDARITDLKVLICGQLISINPYFTAYGLAYDMTYDPLTSTAYVVIKSNNVIIHQFQMQYGCDVQISKVLNNVGSLINNGMSLTMAAASLDIPKEISAGLSGYMDAVHPPVTIVGSASSQASMYTFENILWCMTQHVTALPRNVGYPTYEHRKLDVSGYIQTLDANVECDFIPNVSDQINSTLNSGVYTE